DQLNPPSSERLWAMTFVQGSSEGSADGRRMFVNPSKRRPPSTGMIEQNGITAFRPIERIGDHVRPSFSENDAWMQPSGPCPARTNKRFSPSGSARRNMVGQFRTVPQLSGTGSRSLHVRPPSSLRLSG